MSQTHTPTQDDAPLWKPHNQDDDSASEYTWATDNESTATGHTSRKSRRLVWPDGSIFEGPVNYAYRPEGQGALKASNGDQYCGGWLDGAMHGWGTYFMKQNGIYEGGVANNRRHGAGHFKCVNGLEYQGDWKDDKPHGHGRFSKASAGVYYEGEWRAGKAHGVGDFHAPRWGTYSGEWRNDKKHGEGRVVYADGSEYFGDWSEDLAHGTGKYTWANGDSYEGQFYRGTMTGQGTISMKREGTLYKGMWQNNSREGYGQLTFFDGAVYEGEWAGDRPHGRGVFINPRGVMFRGYWTDGLFDAVQSECDPRGVCTCVVEGNDYVELDAQGAVIPKSIHPVPPPGDPAAAQALPRYRFCELSQIDTVGGCSSETFESLVNPRRDGHPVNPLESGYVYRTTFGKEQLPTNQIVNETTEAETILDETDAPPPLVTTAATYTTQLPIHSHTEYHAHRGESGEQTRTHHSAHCLCGPHCPVPITNIINTHHYCDGRSETGRHVGSPSQGYRFAVPDVTGNGAQETGVFTRIPATEQTQRDETKTETAKTGAPRWARKVESLNKRMPVITPHEPAMSPHMTEWQGAADGPQMDTMTYTNSLRDFSFKRSTPQMSSTEIYEAQDHYVPSQSTIYHAIRPPIPSGTSTSSSTEQRHCHYSSAEPTRRQLSIAKDEQLVVHRNIPVPVEAQLQAHFTLPQIRTTTRVVPYPVYAPRIVEVPVPIENLSESGIALCDSIGLQVEEMRNQRSSAGIDRVAENIYDLLVAAQNIPGSHARPQVPQSLDRYLPANVTALNRPPTKK